MVLIIDTLGLSTNEGRIDRKNEPNFRPVARGAGRDKSGQWPVAGEIEEVRHEAADVAVMTGRQPGHNRMALREGVNRFHEMVCVFRTPDNSDIILIFSLLHVA